ncbi:MAG: hypothetical protein HYV32_01345 [Candidatus Kerfeldbacteria bacterium]|nr:hypothetical protein [Candidatus Kerfeldbacteria bacterium]
MYIGVSRITKMSIVSSIFFVGIFFVAPAIASAQTNINGGYVPDNTAVDTPDDSGTGDLIITTVNLILSLIALISIICLMVGTFKLLTSSGNHPVADKARGLLMGAMFGIVLVMIAWAVTKSVVKYLGY